MQSVGTDSRCTGWTVWTLRSRQAIFGRPAVAQPGVVANPTLSWYLLAVWHWETTVRHDGNLTYGAVWRDRCCFSRRAPLMPWRSRRSGTGARGRRAATKGQGTAHPARSGCPTLSHRDLWLIDMHWKCRTAEQRINTTVYIRDEKHISDSIRFDSKLNLSLRISAALTAERGKKADSNRVEPAAAILLTDPLINSLFAFRYSY